MKIVLDTREKSVQEFLKICMENGEKLENLLYQASELSKNDKNANAFITITKEGISVFVKK